MQVPNIGFNNSCLVTLKLFLDWQSKYSSYLGAHIKVE